MGQNADTVWYIARDGRQYGPITSEDFATFHKEGSIRQTDLIWHPGMSDWVPLAEYEAKAPPQEQEGQAQRQPARVWSSVRALVLKLLSFPRRLLFTITDLVFRPTAFAKQMIDVFPRDLARAGYFYLNLFSIAFLATSSFSHLNNVSGMSQVREFSGLAIQMAVAIILLQIAALLTKQRVRAIGIVQAVLYADALYILSYAVIGSTALLYLATKVTTAEPDLFATEYEACLTRESLLYWLLRGDLTFYSAPIVVSSYFSTSTIVDWLQYVVAAPFCLLFGFLLKGRYGTSAVMMSAAAAGAFVIVVSGYAFAIEKTTDWIRNSSRCFETSIRTVEAKYSRASVLRQTSDKINRELIAKTSELKLMVYPRAAGLAMDLRLREDGSSLLQQAQETMKVVTVLYCDERTQFWYAKRLGLTFTVTVHDPAGKPLLRNDITTAVCTRK